MVDLAEIDARAAEAAAASGQRGEVGNIVRTCPEVTLELGFFFDGTLNNRFNAAARNRPDASYQSAPSNVALLYQLYKEGREHDVRDACGGVGRTFGSEYLEGPGSTRGGSDDMRGYALGTGRTGVEQRVLEAFRRLLRRIGLAGGPPNIKEVLIDVFGFSRGAAGARYFVNAVRARRIVVDAWGPNNPTASLPRGLKVELRHVGIFDTVAAIGDAGDDDNGDVNVHVKAAQARRIFHITAGEEYRLNFSLNHNLPGGGGHKEFPGAHSDVGGGYRDAGDDAPLGREVRRMAYSRAAADRMRAQARAADAARGAHAEDEAIWVREGWMTASEARGGIRRIMGPVRETVIPGAIPRRGYAWTEQLMLHRPWVQVGLSRVALHEMHAQAVGTGAALLPLPRTGNYAIPAGLVPHVGAIRSETLRGAARRYVLRNFGHVSAKTGNLSDWTGHRPRRNHVRVVYPNRPGSAV